MNEYRRSFKFKNCSYIFQRNKYSESFVRYCNSKTRDQLKNTSVTIKKNQVARKSLIAQSGRNGSPDDKTEELSRSKEKLIFDGVLECDSSKSIGEEIIYIPTEAAVEKLLDLKSRSTCLLNVKSVTILPETNSNVSPSNKLNLNITNKLATKTITGESELDFLTDAESNKPNKYIERYNESQELYPSSRFSSFVTTDKKEEHSISTAAVTDEIHREYKDLRSTFSQLSDHIDKASNPKDNQESISDKQKLLNFLLGPKHSQLEVEKYTTKNPLDITYNNFTVNPINITTNPTLQNQNNDLSANSVVNENTCKYDDKSDLTKTKTNSLKKSKCESSKSNCNPSGITVSSFQQTENSNCLNKSTCDETIDSWTQYNVNDTNVCDKPVNVTTQTEFCQNINKSDSTSLREVKCTSNDNVTSKKQEDSCEKANHSDIRISEKSCDLCSDEKEFKEVCKYLFKDDCKFLANRRSFQKSESTQTISQKPSFDDSCIKSKVIEPKFKSESAQTKIIKSAKSDCDSSDRNYRNKDNSKCPQQIDDNRRNKSEVSSRRGFSCSCSETSLKSKEERDRTNGAQSSTKNNCKFCSEETKKGHQSDRRDLRSSRKLCCLHNKCVQIRESLIRPKCSLKPLPKPCSHKKNITKCKVCKQAAPSDSNKKPVTVVEPKNISGSEDSDSEICFIQRRKSSDTRCIDEQAELSYFLVNNKEFSNTSLPYQNPESPSVLRSNCNLKETANASSSDKERITSNICLREDIIDPKDTTCSHQKKGQCEFCYVKLKIEKNPNLHCPHQKKGLCDLCCSILKIKEPEEYSCPHKNKSQCDLCVSRIISKAPVKSSYPHQTKGQSNLCSTKVKGNEPSDSSSYHNRDLCSPKSGKDKPFCQDFSCQSKGQRYCGESESLDKDQHKKTNSHKSERNSSCHKSKSPSQEAVKSSVAPETNKGKKIKCSNIRHKENSPGHSSAKKSNKKAPENQYQDNLGDNSFNLPEACLEQLDKVRHCLINPPNNINCSVTPNDELKLQDCKSKVTRSVVTDKKELNIAKGTIKYIKLATEKDIFVCKEKEEKCGEEAQSKIRHKYLRCSKLKNSTSEDSINAREKTNLQQRTLKNVCEDKNNNLKQNFVPISIPVPRKFECESNLIIENKIRDIKQKESKRRPRSTENRKISSKGRNGVFVFIPCDDYKAQGKKFVELYACLGTLRNPKKKETHTAGFSHIKHIGQSAGRCFKKCLNYLSDTSFSSKNRHPLD